MADLAMDPSGASWFVGIAWQSGVLLLMGLAAAAGMRRQPALAHRIVLLAMVGALLAPAGNRLARLRGWGFWAGASVERSRTLAADAATAAMVPSVASESLSGGPGPWPVGPIESAPATVPAPTPIRSAHVRPDADRREATAAASGTLVGVLRGAWGVLSALCLARLAAAAIACRRAVARSVPVADEALARAAEVAARHLGLGACPELRESEHVRCPSIWCWGRRPVILVPGLAEVATAPTPAVDWVGVFCHELAHRVRNDHWSGLFAEVFVGLFPWNPLAWWARHRLGQLAELACDDWALSVGVPPEDYAESLLGLFPRRGTPLALAAVSSRRGLIGRVRHILDERRIVPAVGRGWALATAIVAALAASAIALAQGRPAESKPAAIAPAVEKPQGKAGAPRCSAHGRVLDPDGRPVPGAEVLWVAYPEGGLAPAVMPKGEDSGRSRPPMILARTKVDADGNYTMGGEFDTAGSVSHFLMVAARGFGLQSHYLKVFGSLPDETKGKDVEVTFRLVPESVIRGRLLTPAGGPAAGARVSLNWFNYNDESRQGMSAGNEASDDELPPYWPRPRPTDSDGRFTLEGVPQEAFVYLTIRHPDCAVEDLTVNTAAHGGLVNTLVNGGINRRLNTFAPHPAGPAFTHTLEPARPVQGRVTDKVNGRPLVGVLVEVTPMQRNGGRSETARTDGDGRYRISGRLGETYNTSVYPPPGSGYLAAHDRWRSWPVGAKVLEEDFALEPGRILTGRVIDGGTKQPIAGASVIYRPKPGNPAGRNGALDIANPVLTGPDGRFAITGLPGEGMLLVEARGGYVRVRLPEGRGERSSLYPNGQADVNVPDRDEAPPVEIALRKGVAYTARVVGPDGQPVAPFAAYCPPNGANATYLPMAVNYPDPQFVFPGADPTRTYRAIVVAAAHKLAAVVEIRPDARDPQPAEIRLQPTARVHGKALNPGGTPMREGEVYPMIVLEGSASEPDRNTVRAQEFYVNLMEGSARQKYMEAKKTGAGGEFACDALVAGKAFYIVAASGRREGYRYVEPLKPGEDRDLGTITLKEQQP